jgi:hypothetical protein
MPDRAGSHHADWKRSDGVKPKSDGPTFDAPSRPFEVRLAGEVSHPCPIPAWRSGQIGPTSAEEDLGGTITRIEYERMAEGLGGFRPLALPVMVHSVGEGIKNAPKVREGLLCVPKT